MLVNRILCIRLSDITITDIILSIATIFIAIFTMILAIVTALPFFSTIQKTL
jgi:hypothetical protein